jgi:hypothetical protein
VALRVTERTDQIAHIPFPLYSWRKVPGSAASSLDFRHHAYETGKWLSRPPWSGEATGDRWSTAWSRGGTECGMRSGAILASASSSRAARWLVRC